MQSNSFVEGVAIFQVEAGLAYCLIGDTFGIPWRSTATAAHESGITCLGLSKFTYVPPGVSAKPLFRSSTQNRLLLSLF